MELIEGNPLNDYASQNSIAIKHSASPQQITDYITDLKDVWGKVVDILLVLHDNQIIYGDLSPTNLMFHPESGGLKIIDFEGAYEATVDEPTFLFTPGFANDTHKRLGAVGFSNDYYSLGAVFLFTIMPINAIMDIAPRSIRKFLAEITIDYNLPTGFQKLILNLLNDQYDSLLEVKEEIKNIHSPKEITMTQPKPQEKIIGPSSLSLRLIDMITNYIYQVADHSRSDRLFPADTYVFSKNGLNIAYGAFGILYALKLLNAEIPNRWLDWGLAKLREQECPPGLYVGYGGIAWVLYELRYRQMAESVFKNTFENPLIYKDAEILCGASGWGLAALKFWLATNNELYLAQAKKIGDWLLKNKKEESGNYYWPNPDGITWLGYARGVSGVALFLLYLYLSTGETKYLDAGNRALMFDLSLSTYWVPIGFRLPLQHVGR